MDDDAALGVLSATRPEDDPPAERLDRRSGSGIGAGCFPPDPRKRAAG